MKKLFGIFFLALILLGCTQPANPDGTTPSANATPWSSSPSIFPIPSTANATPYSTFSASALPTPSSIPADEQKLDEPFSISIGQSASILSEDLKITFVNVTEDSRCPKSVTCVWAGQVSAEFSFDSEGSPLGQAVLTLGALTASEFNLGMYSLFLLDITPYPEKSAPRREEYQARIKVSKSQNTESWILSMGETVVSCGVWIRFDGATRAPGTRSDWKHGFTILEGSKDPQKQTVIEEIVSYGDEPHTIKASKVPLEIRVESLTVGNESSATFSVVCGTAEK